MLGFAHGDIEVQKDGISHSHTLNHWQCMGQSPGLLTLYEPLDCTISQHDLKSHPQSQKTAL